MVPDTPSPPVDDKKPLKKAAKKAAKKVISPPRRSIEEYDDIIEHDYDDDVDFD